MAATDALIELATLFTSDSTLSDEISLALNDPAAYLQQFVDSLSERGIASARPDLAWFALLDGLKARARAAELDWKSSPGDVLFGLNTLVNMPRDGWDGYVEECDRRVNPDRDSFVECYLQIADLRTAPHGLSVLVLDSGGDSYPAALLETSKVARALELAGEAGLGAMSHMQGSALPV
jgi:hypothetical protein